MRGQAADICTGEKVANMTEFKAQNLEIARLIVKNGRFDQLILYPTFLHVSYKCSGANRHRVLRKTVTGYAEISHREIC